MSKKPEFLSKKGRKAINKKKKVFILDLGDGVNEEFIIDWTISHQETLQRQTKRTGDASLIRKIADIQKRYFEMTKLVEKEKGKKDEEVGEEEKLELFAQMLEMYEECSSILFTILLAYGVAEFPGDWSREDAESLHTLILSSYEQEELIKELLDLFMLIVAGSPAITPTGGDAE